MSVERDLRPAPLTSHPEVEVNLAPDRKEHKSQLQRTRLLCSGFYSTPRCRRASYNSTAAATETFSDSTTPASGIETSASHIRRTSGRRPFASAPRTIATPPVRSVSHIG